MVSNTVNLGPINLPGSSGLWVGVALFGGIMVSGTKAAPIAFGLLSVALIYQLQQLFSGTPTNTASGGTSG